MRQTDSLVAEVERIAADCGADVGFGCLHVESGAQASLNGDRAFCMASTYKIAIAARLLRRVDDGEYSLDQMIDITQDDLSPGGGLVKAHIYHPGLALSIHNLIHLAMTVSDNTSTDKMLELAGGSEAVNDLLGHAGVEGMRVDRSTKLLICDAFGVTDRMPASGWSHAFLTEQAPLFQKGVPDESADRFLADPRDTSTPAAMVQLLERLHRGELLSPEGSRVLVDIMERCDSGASRLRGFLPASVAVQHKTGTIPRVCVNDAGIILLPDGGHVVVVVFVQATSAAEFIGGDRSEAVIAQLGRAAYDWGLYAG
jgi:beta-lactamase class A